MLYYVTFDPSAVKNQNCMHFAEEHCCGSDCVDEYSYFSNKKEKKREIICSQNTH